MTVEESDLFDAIYQNAQQPEPKRRAKPKAKPSSQASSSQAPFVKNIHLKPKAGVTTGTQIPPSKIGIQKLREELENAKNNKY